jgi:hypothetical protein
MSNTLLYKILLYEEINAQETAFLNKFLEEKRLKNLEKETKKKKK